jgi:hypothetical protein
MILTTLIVVVEVELRVVSEVRVRVRVAAGRWNSEWSGLKGREDNAVLLEDHVVSLNDMVGIGKEDLVEVRVVAYGANVDSWVGVVIKLGVIVWLNKDVSGATECVEMMG